jgi:addiction module RelE/StbE family toxin
VGVSRSRRENDGNMGYTVILSPKAVGDLETIVRYISSTNPSAAKKIGQSLLEKTKELSQFPFKGQKVPEFDSPSIRQLILKPYRVVYRVEEDKKRISIARFWHSSQENLEL